MKTKSVTKSKKPRNPRVKTVLAAILLALVAAVVLAAHKTGQPVVAKTNLAPTYSNALELQYARP